MTSFEIIGNGKSLDVAEGTKLTTEFVATTFNESSVFEGSYSYPILFPLTPNNIDFFEHSHHLENRSARKTKDVIIVLFGTPWKTAKLEYTVNRKGYEGSLKVDNGAVADWMRDVTLPSVFSSEESGKITHKSIAIGTNAASVQSHILSNIANINGYVWPTYINSNADGILKSGNEAMINDFNNMVVVAEDKLYNPYFFHTWIIKAICDWMGYKAVGSYLDDQFIESLIIYNNGLRTGSDWKNQKKINPAEHLPNITIAEYFKNIRNDHRVMIYFDSLTNTAHFELCTVLLSADDRLDLRDVIHYDSLEIESQNNASFKLVAKIDENDELYKNAPYEKSVLVGYDFTNSKELALGIGRLYMSSGIALKGVSNVTIPVTQQLANIYSEPYNTDEFEAVYNAGNEISKNSFALRMMSYKGLQSLGSSNHKIPFCTGNDKGNGSIQYANSLDQGGSTGLINKYTLQYYRFYCASEKVNVIVQMNAINFFNIHPLQKMYISDRNLVPVEALMDKVVFEPQSDNNIVGKISCYPNYDLLGSAQGMKVLVGSAIIENTDGVIYVKLFARSSRTQPIPNRPAVISTYVNLTLEFYADAAGVIPYSVNNIPYKISIKKYDRVNSSSGSYYTYNESGSSVVSGVASGASYLHGEILWKYAYEYEFRPFLEQNGVEFTNLGSYNLINGQWATISE